jgi:hypothetical protein
MRRLAAIAAVAGLAAAWAGSAASGPRLVVHWLPASPRNYAHVYRPSRLIREVVIHVSEGTYFGTIAWFRNPHARASANYVVSRDGDVTQMVSERRVAWHAGNAWVNLHSIGIEHEGYVGVPYTFTDAEYRASAQLLASIMRHYVLPIDRRHVIGHNEVPDPNHPGQFGGYAHHTDPGRYWDWQRYMAYVRAYAAGRTPPAPVLDVTEPGLELVQTVTGTLDWQAAPAGEPVQRVDFLVDGSVVGTAAADPYALEWDSTTVPNGRHVLSVQAVGIDGRTVEASIVGVVSNPPVKITSTSLADGSTVSGVVPVTVTVTRPAQRIELLVDGEVRATAYQQPYVLQWDTTKDEPGWHLITIRAVTRGYALSAVNLTVEITAP